MKTKTLTFNVLICALLLCVVALSIASVSAVYAETTDGTNIYDDDGNIIGTVEQNETNEDGSPITSRDSQSGAGNIGSGGSSVPSSSSESGTPLQPTPKVTQTQSAPTKNNTCLIVGVSVGSAVVLAAAVFVTVLCVKKKRKFRR